MYHTKKYVAYPQFSSSNPYQLVSCIFFQIEILEQETQLNSEHVKELEEEVLSESIMKYFLFLVILIASKFCDIIVGIYICG